MSYVYNFKSDFKNEIGDNYVDREIAKILKGFSFPDSTKEFIEIFRKFLISEKSSSKKSEETLRGYINVFRILLKFDTDVCLSKINVDYIDDFFHIIDERHNVIGRMDGKNRPTKYTKGLKTSTISTYRHKLNRFFVWLVERNKLSVNPFWYIKAPSVEYINKKYLSKNEIERIVATLYSIPWKNNFIKSRNIAIFTLLLRGGLRRSELTSIDINDVNLDEGEFVIRADNSKSKIDRTIPLSDGTVNIVKRYVQERNKIQNINSLNLFINEKGERFSNHGLKHLVEKMKKISKVNFHLHRFRHTFVMSYAKNNGNPFELKELLGHKDLRMTQAYLKLIPTEDKRKTINKLDNIDNLVN
jgi:integrase